MAAGSTWHSNDLESILPPELRNPSEAERRLLRAAPVGDFGLCGPNYNDKDPANDLTKAESWGNEREIRADMIRWLCTSPEATKRIDPRGIRAYGAKITGALDLSVANVPFPLRLVHCRIMNDCEMRYIKIPVLYLDGAMTRSINAEGADVKGDIFFSAEFLAEGEVRLQGAQIGGDLVCNGGRFKNTNGPTLNASNVNVKGNISLTNAVFLGGEVNLILAQIGGNLECEGGSFTNPNGYAINAAAIEVRGHIYFNKGFTASGTVSLVTARADGDVECDGGSFTTFQLISGTVRQTFGWHDVKAVTQVDVRLAKVGVLWDDKASWPPKEYLLEGFVYGAFIGGPTDATTRLDWLDRQTDFTPQPYRQFAKVLHEMGDDDGEKKVLHELERRKRAEERRKLGFVGRLFNLAESGLSDATVGYGIYPRRAIYYLSGLTALGWIIHRRAQQMGAMVPTDKDANAEFRTQGRVPAYYPPFSPLVYSLENCVPLVKFGQDDRWEPDPSPVQLALPPAPPGSGLATPPAKPQRVHKSLLDLLTSPVALRWFRWIMIAVGWLLATFFVAGISGIIKTG